MTERRAEPRYEVTASVELRPVGEAAAGPDAGARVRNLSLGGICVETTAPPELGSLVDVVLRLPDLPRPLVLRGQVAWRNREPPPDIGVRWSRLAGDDRERLRRYLARVAEGPREE